jgi:undecaprenyl-phosphate 4-deoxy-4-formamido-L-arabinose transferase
MKKLSFVIPCYGSENTIGTVVDEIVTTVNADGRYDYEIILVNDSSPDRVFDKIIKLSEANPKIKGIDLARNFGQHSAIMTGFSFVTGDIAVALDDD